MVKPLFLLSVVFLAGSAAASAAPAFQDSAKPADASAHAKEVYKVDCAICHGENGDGKTEVAQSMGLVMTDFTDPATLQGKSDKDLFNIIRQGKDKMPPEDAGRAKDADVRGLIVYIRSMAKAGHVPAAAPAATPTEAPAATPAATPTPPGR